MPATVLNYHHLRYFWMVAREGSLAAAGAALRLSHPTLSAQIHALEDQIGVPLFAKSGRRLVLTEAGRIAYRYADEIFSLGRELVESVEGRASGRIRRLDVGIADVLPKFVVRRLLEPALVAAEPVRLVCREAPFERLLASLALHELDLVLSDAPVPSGSPIRAFHHLLGETAVGFFATRTLAKKLRPGFPKSLDGAPFLLPLEGLSLRRALDHWFDRHRLAPRVVAEFQDAALLKVFGADGVGVFPAPLAIEEDVVARYRAVLVGVADGVRERFYAISAERRLQHPAVMAISLAASESLDS